MAIAIPSITRYITQSRRKTVVSSIDGYVSSVVNSVNDQDYKFTEPNTIYAVPIECISLEKGGKNPFGKWLQANPDYWAYVLVQYDSETFSYTYGFTFKDSAGYGMYPTAQSAIDSKSSTQIKTGLELTKPESGPYTNIAAEKNWNGFDITPETQVIVLASTEGNADGQTTCMLCQKGDNYEQVKQENEENESITLSSLVTDGTDNQACVVKGQICGNGTLFTIKVNEAQTEDFYVIADDGNKVTLLLNRNLYDKNNANVNVAWNKDTTDNSQGPLTALTALQERTSTWTNLPTMEIGTFVYDGEEVLLGDNKTFITCARLPKNDEIELLDYFLVNLYVTGDSNTYGYWMATADSSDTEFANHVGWDYFIGYYTGGSRIGYESGYGIRPVIELYK